MPNSPPARTVQLVYVDRADVSETFVSSLRRWSVDGVNVHLEFAVNRPTDPVEPDGPMCIQVVTAARLVIPVSAMQTLQSALSDVIASLQREVPAQPNAEGPTSIN